MGPGNAAEPARGDALSSKRFLLGPWWCAAVLLLGACLPMARVLADPQGSLPGSEFSDVYKHAWSYWHTLRQISDGQWPRTSYLNFPQGGLLLDVMLLPNLLMAPVTLLAGPVLACNLWVLLMLGAVGLGTYLLAFQVTENRAGALCAGLLVQTTPYILGHPLTSGVHERLLIWIFPVTLLGLLRIRLHGERFWVLLLPALTVVLGLSCPTYGLFLAVLMVISLPLTLHRARNHASGLRVRLALACYLLMLLSLVGAAAAYHWLVLHPDWLTEVPHQRVMPSIGVTAPRMDIASFASLLDPLAVQREVPIRVEDELYCFVYLGWIPFLSILGGLVLAIKRRRIELGATLAIAFCFLLLSLGPKLSVGPVQLPNLLFYLAAYLLPFYGGAMPVWQQAGLFVVFGAAGTAALAALVQRPRLQWGVIAVLLGATLGERVWALPVPLVLQRADAAAVPLYDRAREAGGLADIPRYWAGERIALGPLFLAQTRHGHPIPLGINTPLGFFDSYDPLLRGVARSWEQVARCLRRHQYRWLVVHRDQLKTPQRARRCVQGLRAALGEPTADDGVRVLFDLSRLKTTAGDNSAGSSCPGTVSPTAAPAQPEQ